MNLKPLETDLKRFMNDIASEHEELVKNKQELETAKNSIKSAEGMDKINAADKLRKALQAALDKTKSEYPGSLNDVSFMVRASVKDGDSEITTIDYHGAHDAVSLLQATAAIIPESDAQPHFEALGDILHRRKKPKLT